MSTILRALQRVEGEKSGEREMTGLREGLVPDAPPAVPERRGRVRFGISVLLAALLLGCFLWWLIPADETSPPSAVSAPPAPAEPQSAPESGEAPAPAVRLEAKSAPAEPEPLLAEEPPAPPASWSAESLPPFQPPEVTPPLEELTQVPGPDEARPPVVELAEEPPPVLVETPAPRVPAPARVATLRPPEVMVKKTVWHPVPERRVAEVEVEGRKGVLELHEGDAVGTLVISEIQPSGVVFLHGGERLHRKVGAAQ